MIGVTGQKGEPEAEGEQDRRASRLTRVTVVWGEPDAKGNGKEGRASLLAHLNIRASQSTGATGTAGEPAEKGNGNDGRTICTQEPLAMSASNMQKTHITRFKPCISTFGTCVYLGALYASDKA